MNIAEKWTMVTIAQRNWASIIVAKFCITNSDLGIAEVVTHGTPTTSEPVLDKRGLKGLTQQARHQLGVL